MKKLVFTAGCFDGGLHKGHLHLLSEARKQGDYLVVSINRDAYLARKGPGRPILVEAERVRSLYQTGLVDEVVIHDDSPLDWVVKLRPDVIVVGDDYTEKTTVGAKEIRAWNGRVHFVKKISGVSTTALVDGEYIIRLHDHAPSGDYTPYVTSADADGDWEWMPWNEGVIRVYRFRSIKEAKNWIASHEWLRRPIGPAIEGFSLVRVRGNKEMETIHD